MKKYAIGLAVGVALTLALAGTGGARDPDVLDVTLDVEQGKGDKALADKAAAIAKKGRRLDDLMKVYRLKEKGGLGFGPNPNDKSGLEAKIIALQRGTKGPSAETLKKEEPDLLKLAHLNVAMAEIARPHFPGNMGGKTRKDWDRYLDDQKKASKDLAAAVKARKGPDVAKAAKDLVNSCTECHAYFRP